MVHLPALPGTPLWGGDIKAWRAAVKHDAEALRDGGVEAILLMGSGVTAERVRRFVDAARKPTASTIGPLNADRTHA